MKKEKEIEIKLSIKKEKPTLPQTKITTNTLKVSPNSMNSNFKKILLFSLISFRPNKDNKKKEILEVFKKVEFNISLIDVIKQIPKYTKFLKELCTTKRAYKLKGYETVSISEIVFVVV